MPCRLGPVVLAIDLGTSSVRPDRKAAGVAHQQRARQMELEERLNC
jgi:hypothetical protein